MCGGGGGGRRVNSPEPKSSSVLQSEILEWGNKAIKCGRWQGDEKKTELGIKSRRFVWKDDVRPPPLCHFSWHHFWMHPYQYSSLFESKRLNKSLQMHVPQTDFIDKEFSNPSNVQPTPLTPSALLFTYKHSCNGQWQTPDCSANLIPWTCR